MTKTARYAAGIGGLLVAAALGVTAAAAAGGIHSGVPLSARPVAATVAAPSSQPAPAPGARPHAQDGSFAAWAAALGVEESTLRSALEQARRDVRAQRTRPADQAAAQTALVTSLATHLGKPAAQVRQTFQAFLAAHQAGSRDALARRLDAAVAAGKLTDAERDAILKAYDAGVLGRGGGAPGRMGHLGGHDKTPATTGPRA